MTIQIKSGSDARSLLEDASFKKKWHGLFTNCRWVTPNQSYDFIKSWYDTYSKPYTPLLVFQLSSQNELNGLLPLAIDKTNQSLVVAGAHQAEYQTWLADVSCEETFIQESLQMIFENLRIGKVNFKFVLDTTPIEWLSSKRWRKYSVIKPRKRPMIKLSGDAFQLRSLSTKHFRNGLNRLKRLGEVTYSQIVDRDAFINVLPKLEIIYDFRMLATYGVAPFSSDPYKRAFHQALFDKENLLHVSALLVNKEIVAFEMALQDNKTLYAMIASFSPMLTHANPTKVCSYFLFQDVIENNFSFYDLTPGRDAYKFKMANTIETVFEITLFNSSLRRHLFKLQALTQDWILAILIQFGANPSSIGIIAKSIGHNFIKGILYDTYKMIFPQVKVRYRVNMKKATQLPEHYYLNRDRVEDFLELYPENPGGLLNNFFAKSQKNFYLGYHSYTTTDDDLFFCGWLAAPIKPKQIASTLPEQFNQKKVAVIQDITALGEDVSIDFLETALSQMIREGALADEIEELIVFIPVKTTILRKAINGLNIKYSQLLEVVTG